MIFQKKKKKLSTLYILFSSNNTIASLVDFIGNVVFSVSCGHLKYKGSNKGTHAAAQHLCFFVAKEAIKYGFYSIELKIRGVGKGRSSVVKDLLKGGLKVTKISDLCASVFNGCRVFKGKL